MKEVKVVWYEEQDQDTRLLGVDFLDSFNKQKITPTRYRLDVIEQSYATKLIKLLHSDNEEAIETFRQAILWELGKDAP